MISGWWQNWAQHPGVLTLFEASMAPTPASPFSPLQRRAGNRGKTWLPRALPVASWMGAAQIEKEGEGKREVAEDLRGCSGNEPAWGLPKDNLESWWERNSALQESKAKGRTGEPRSLTQ